MVPDDMVQVFWITTGNEVVEQRVPQYKVLEGMQVRTMSSTSRNVTIVYNTRMATGSHVTR
jgi:hypothetical protein